MVLQSHLTNQMSYISTTARPLVIKLGKAVSYYKGLRQHFKHMAFGNHGTNQKCFIFSTTMPEATKVISMVT